MKAIARRKSKLIKSCMVVWCRLLTLAVFFNFSGLNNGIASFAVSSGRVEGLSFAPVLVREVGMRLNPKHWARTASDLKRFGFLFHASAVVTYASRGAVQNMIANAALTRVWFSSFLKTSVALPVSDSRVSVDQQSGEQNPVIQEKQCYEMIGQGYGYLSGVKDESWIALKRFLLQEGRKCRFSGFLIFMVHGRWRNKDNCVNASLSLYHKEWDVPRNIGTKFWRRVIYSASDSKDEPANLLLLTACIFKITPTFRWGDFLLRAYCYATRNPS